mgnify:CR=1 FL=1
MVVSKVKGTGVALVTPFTSNGEVDFSALEKLVNHVIDGGVNYLVVLGTTGESATLTKSEKISVLNKVKEVAGNFMEAVSEIGDAYNHAVKYAGQLDQAMNVGRRLYSAIHPLLSKNMNSALMSGIAQYDEGRAQVIAQRACCDALAAIDCRAVGRMRTAR